MRFFTRVIVTFDDDIGVSHEQSCSRTYYRFARPARKHRSSPSCNRRHYLHRMWRHCVLHKHEHHNTQSKLRVHASKYLSAQFLEWGHHHLLRFKVVDIDHFRIQRIFVITRRTVLGFVEHQLRDRLVVIGRQSVALSLLLTSVVLTSAGCTSSGVPSLSLWEADIAQAKAAAQSDFERAVFADNQVTQAEYAEAVQRFVQCVNDNGLPGFVAEDPHHTGLFTYAMESPDAASAEADNETYGRLADLCSPGTSASIEPLYVNMTSNPTREDESLVRVRCLDRAGLVDADYTAEQYNADESADTFPFDRADEAAVRCFLNPSVQ